METIQLERRPDASEGIQAEPLLQARQPRMRPRPLNVLVLCHFGRTGYNILRALSALHAKVYAVIDDRSASLRYTRQATIAWRVKNIREVDPVELTVRINALHEQVGLDSVMATDVDGLLPLAAIRERIAAPLFPIASGDVIQTLDNKWSFAQLCRDVGVPIPKTIYFPSKSAFDRRKVASDIGFPCIVKPAAGYGQRGIEILRDMTDAYVFQSLQIAYPHGMVVQRFVEGTDWAISVLARDGAIKHWTSWDCPGQLDANHGVSRFLTTQFHARADLYSMAEKICRASGFSGVANFDTRLDDSTGQMVMFECNPRFFGRLAAARLCGLDFVAAGLPGMPTQPECLDQGRYYPWQELFSGRGVDHLRSGRWDRRMLIQDLYEMLCRDPLPPVVRKLSREDSKP